MGNALVIGNGSLLVNINDTLQVTDFYFPYVGQENHLSIYPNEMFFRINGEFVTIDHNSFEIDINYIEDTLVGYSTLRHIKSNLIFKFIDFIVPNSNTFIRSIEVFNNSNNINEVYIYSKNNFSIYETEIGDTTLWHEPSRLLVHYKKNRYIGIGSSNKFYQFTCAAKNDNDGLGAHPDLKTGELQFNPISNGNVSSCISFKYSLKADERVNTNIFHVTGSGFDDIKASFTKVNCDSTDNLILSATHYWQNWIRSKTKNIFKTESFPIKFFGDEAIDSKIFKLYKRSLLTIRTQIDNNGAIIAANDGRYTKEGGKDTYSYFWPRDGAYVVLSLIETGYKELSDKYFEFLSNIITRDGYFLHKYYTYGENNSNALGSSWHPWVDKFGHLQLPIQEDETALNIYAIWMHYLEFADQEFIKKYWDKLIFPMANFLGNYRYTIDYESTNLQSSFSGFELINKPNTFDSYFSGTKIPRPSYDLWEERKGISLFTCSTVYAGLIAASNLCRVFGKFNFDKTFRQYAQEVKDSTLKYLINSKDNTFLPIINCNSFDNSIEISDEIDSSVYGIWNFGMLDPLDERVARTMDKVEKRLSIRTEIGGLARRENDPYNRVDNNITGNPWFVSTLWMAQYYIKIGKLDEAKKYISWVVTHADKSGLIAEQSNPYTGFSESVKPLTWSHSEFVRTINMLRSKKTEITKSK